MSTKISIKNLTYSYSPDGQAILKDVDIEIEKGEFYAILGASGSGKSTLLRLMSDILPSSKSHKIRGEINIYGSDVKAYLQGGKLAFMFQEPSLMPNLNVTENVAFPLKLRGVNVDYDFVNELLSIVGLDGHSTKYPKELSGGMKTRVALARAFVTKPELLLLDEPFSALDISWKYELYRYLQVFADKYGTTVILVTHDIQEAILLGNKVMVLSKKGKVLTERIPRKPQKIDFTFESINKVLSDNLETSLGLQNDILIDGIRSKVEGAQIVINEIEKAIITGNENDPIVFEKVQKLRSFKNDNDVHSQMKELWSKSNSVPFRYEVIWFLLDKQKVDHSLQLEVFEFMKSNENAIIHFAGNQEYFREAELLLKTKERLNDPEYPESKSWLYLVHSILMSSNDTNLANEVYRFVKGFLNKMPETPYLEFVRHFLNKYSDEK